MVNTSELAADAAAFCYLVDKQGYDMTLTKEDCELIVDGALCRRVMYQDTARCPKGWFHNEANEKCYFREEGRMNWDTAQSRCASYGANLVTPFSIDEVVSPFCLACFE